MPKPPKPPQAPTIKPQTTSPLQQEVSPQPPVSPRHRRAHTLATPDEWTELEVLLEFLDKTPVNNVTSKPGIPNKAKVVGLTDPAGKLLPGVQPAIQQTEVNPQSYGPLPKNKNSYGPLPKNPQGSQPYGAIPKDVLVKKAEPVTLPEQYRQIPKDVLSTNEQKVQTDAPRHFKVGVKKTGKMEFRGDAPLETNQVASKVERARSPSFSNVEKELKTYKVHGETALISSAEQKSLKQQIFGFFTKKTNANDRIEIGTPTNFRHPITSATMKKALLDPTENAVGEGQVCKQ